MRLCRKHNFNEPTALAASPYALIHLRGLDLSFCDVSDVSALSRFRALEECNLSYNRIVLDSIPENLINLRKLKLWFCNLRDVSSLGRLPALQEVEVHENRDLVLDTVPAGVQLDMHCWEWFGIQTVP